MKKIESVILDIHLKNALQTYLRLIHDCFPDQELSIYIVGSVVFGDYWPGKSDIDFITVREKDWDSFSLHRLEHLHNKLRKLIRSPKFDGVYLTFEELRRNPILCSPPFVLNNHFHHSKGFAANPITWKILKTDALVLSGKEELDVVIDDEYITKWCIDNVKTYWKNWVNDISFKFPQNLKGLLEKSAEWGVLGISRSYVTIFEKKIVSKTESAKILKQEMEPRWHTILDSILEIRTGTSRKHMCAIKRRKLVIEYMNFVIAQIEQISNLP